MKLADDVEFELGMTIFATDGRAITTDPALHKVEQLHFAGHEYFCIGLRSTGPVGMDFDLRRFYSSRRAAFDSKIASLRSEIRDLEETIVHLGTERDQDGGASN